MGTTELRKNFIIKLKNELQLFQVEIMSGEPEVIYENAFRITSVNTIYQILKHKAYSLNADVIVRLMMMPDVLMYLYELWIKEEDFEYMEIERFIDENILSIKVPLKITRERNDVFYEKISRCANYIKKRMAFIS